MRRRCMALLWHGIAAICRNDLAAVFFGWRGNAVSEEPARGLSLADLLAVFLRRLIVRRLPIADRRKVKLQDT